MNPPDKRFVRCPIFSEGHVIHWNVSNPATAMFLFETSRPGPQLRLLYECKSDSLSGKFLMKMSRPERVEIVSSSGAEIKNDGTAPD